MSETPLLALPVMEAAQAQKHVTHNEALQILDGAIQLSVVSRGLTSPPAAPADGSRFLIATPASGAWSGHGGQAAMRQPGGWIFSTPRKGWRLWVEDEEKFLVFDGTAWRDLIATADFSNVAKLGVNAAADTTNRLAVSSPSVLFNHAGAGQQVKINKQSAADTASVLFQSGFSGRAEMGLAGDNDFHLKVSPDGANWAEAIVINRSSGTVSFPNTPPVGSDAFATRTGLVALVAGGTVRANGTISHAAGLAYRWQSGAVEIADLPGLVPAGERTILHHGAVADGTTDAVPAIQSAINAAAAGGGGIVMVPVGTYAAATAITLKSNVTLKGQSRASVIRPTAGFAAAGYVILNQNFTINDYVTRTDKDLGVEDLVFDGSLRPFAMYPTAGYASQGSMILFMRCERPFVRNCVFRDYRAGWGIVGQGNRGAAFLNNEFLRMGKADIDTGGILNINYGSRVRNIITAVSQANPCVITFAYPHNFSAGIKYVRGIRGMTQLADGEYNVTAVTAFTVTLGAIDSTAYSAFVFDAEAEMTDRYGLRSEGAVITGNRFHDLYRTAISDSGDASKISNNHVDGAGETGIYLNFAKNAVVTSNTIRNVLLNDISGCGIEINWGVNHIIRNNQISRSECNAVACNGMVGGSISGNVIKECGLTSGMNYPSAPSSVAQGIAGTPLIVDERAMIFVTNYQDWPVRDVEIAGNDLIDTRNGPARLTSYGIRVAKTGVDNRNQGLRIANNRFAGLTGLAEANWVSFNSATAAQGCWVEYQHPVSGHRIIREASGSGTFAIPAATLATLPTGTAGAVIYVSNGLKPGEAAGAGTGACMFHDGAAWRYADTGVADGDKGDITVSGLGSIWTIDAAAVSTAKLGGDITAAGKALLDDASATVQRSTLGLTIGTDVAAAVHAHAAGQISDFAEAVDDRVAALLTAGSNITLTYNDAANTLTIAAAGGAGGGLDIGQYRKLRTLERTR